MPMGAVIFADFWLVKRFRLQSYAAQIRGSSFNWAAGLTWFITLALCIWMVKFGGVQIFFVSLPGWFVATVLYLSLSKLYQKGIPA